MRRILGATLALAAALLVLGGVYIAHASDRTGPPPGVAADRWFPIGDDLGIAIDDMGPVGRLPQEQLSKVLPALGARGRLFARVNGAWVPVYLKADPEGLYPAH